MSSRKKHQTVRDTMPKEYRFDYSRAKPNRFREKMSEGVVAVVLEPDVAAIFKSSEAVNALLRSVIATMPRSPSSNRANQRPKPLLGRTGKLARSGGACDRVSTLCSHRRVVGRECLSFALQEEYASCMQHLTLPIIIESDQDGYFVTCPALQGCYSQGETYEEAVTNIKDAIRLHIEDRLADGEEIPQAVSVSLSTVEIAV